MTFILANIQKDFGQLVFQPTPLKQTYALWHIFQLNNMIWQFSYTYCHKGKMPYPFWLWQFSPMGIFLFTSLTSVFISQAWESLFKKVIVKQLWRSEKFIAQMRHWQNIASTVLLLAESNRLNPMFDRNSKVCCWPDIWNPKNASDSLQTLLFQTFCPPPNIRLLEQSL